jgi:hypothetical protein
MSRSRLEKVTGIQSRNSHPSMGPKGSLLFSQEHVMGTHPLVLFPKIELNITLPSIPSSTK